MTAGCQHASGGCDYPTGECSGTCVKTGGPAFPRQHVVADANDPAFKLGNEGMTLRDYIAAQAMQGLLSHPIGRKPESGQSVVEAHAVAAYEYADAMLAAREKL